MINMQNIIVMHAKQTSRGIIEKILQNTRNSKKFTGKNRISYRKGNI